MDQVPAPAPPHLPRPETVEVEEEEAAVEATYLGTFGVLSDFDFGMEACVTSLDSAKSLRAYCNFVVLSRPVWSLG